jgi:hypothetical protein
MRLSLIRLGAVVVDGLVDSGKPIEMYFDDVLGVTNADKEQLV